MPRGVYKRTEEGKKNMSKGQQKRIERDGCMQSPEARKKISKTILKRKEELGYIHSPETRKILSIALTGRTFSEEHKKNLSKAKKGIIPWNKGLTKETDERLKKFSKMAPWNKGLVKETDEGVKRISDARLKRKKELGYINSPEARKKISITKKGMKFSEEHKKNIGKAHFGDKNYMWNPNRAEVYAPYGENFRNKKLRNDKWDLQNGRDMLTGTMLDPNKKPGYHHIDYIKSNDDPNNHCFISSSNHMRITVKQQNPIKSERYKKILQENTLALKNGEIPKHWSPLNKELFRQEKLKQLNLSLYI